MGVKNSKQETFIEAGGKIYCIGDISSVKKWENENGCVITLKNGKKTDMVGKNAYDDITKILGAIRVKRY